MNNVSIKAYDMLAFALIEKGKGQRRSLPLAAFSGAVFFLTSSVACRQDA